MRVTPGVEAHTHEYVMTGQDDSKFGFGLASGDAARGGGTAPPPDEPGYGLVGVHAHIGSQIFALEAYRAAPWRYLAPFSTGSSLEELCIGGGLGVAYVTGETAPSITEWAKVLRQAAAAAGIADHVVLSAEPGRSIVATAATHLLHGRHYQGPARSAYLRQRRRRDERQPAAGALRLRVTRLSCPGKSTAPSAPGGDSGGQALRVGGRARP